MPRKPREAWEKVPHKWKWRCKVCGELFDSATEAEKHVTEDCIHLCARCGVSLNGKRWQAKYCGPSCRVMDCRDRNAGKPTRKRKPVAKTTATKTSKATKTVLDWCEKCKGKYPHRKASDGYWYCEKCGN